MDDVRHIVPSIQLSRSRVTLFGQNGEWEILVKVESESQAQCEKPSLYFTK